jgi:ABC-type amino acid transport system permease subunit
VVAFLFPISLSDNWDLPDAVSILFIYKSLQLNLPDAVSILFIYKSLQLNLPDAVSILFIYKSLQLKYGLFDFRTMYLSHSFTNIHNFS